jgi:peptide/nickel transport system permease protein
MTTPSTPVAVLDSEQISTIKEESPLQVVWKRFRKHKLAMVSLFVMGFIFLASVLVTVLAPFEIAQITSSPSGRSTLLLGRSTS